MLLSSLDSKGTMKHLFLFTNTALQRERVLICTHRDYATAINFPCLIPYSVVQCFEMSKEKGLGWIYKVPLLREDGTCYRTLYPFILIQFWTSKHTFSYSSWTSKHTFSYSSWTSIHIFSYSSGPVYKHSHTVPGPWFT